MKHRYHRKSSRLAGFLPHTVRFTYHSNAIEGNTLTQHETEMILSHGITVGGKTLVEHLEVIGHRDAIEYMEELAAPTSDAPLGEWEIRNLHSLILRPVDQATGQNEAGRYRTLDGRAAGTEHLYPPHYQVPELMQAFTTWLQSPTAQALHPVTGAAQAHYRFVSIHPFRDGTGRTGRLLMNLWLLRAGYPIAIISNAERAAYIDALVWGQSHADDVAPLTALIASACRALLLETLSVLATAGESRGRGGAFYEGCSAHCEHLIAAGSVSFEWRYRDKEGNWHRSHSFNDDDLLALAKLADQAHSKILELRYDIL